MAAPDPGAGNSVTPTQGRGFILRHASRKSDDFTSNMSRPATKDSRSLSSSSTHLNQRGGLQSLVSVGGPPGSFSSEFKTAISARTGTPQSELTSFPLPLPRMLSKDGLEVTSSGERQALVRDRIGKEMKIKLGTENMLEALLKNPKQTKEQRHRVELELGSSNRKLAELKLELDQEIQRAQSPSTPPGKRMSGYFRPSPSKSPSMAATPYTDPNETNDSESPTIVLTETLQALEVEGMQPDYYIDRANVLVELFKRNPTLKYDLAWSDFSLRVQMMLLSESSDVVAAGYRLTRHAIADRASLNTIRRLHTDKIVILSLVKKGKVGLEREQAVKFVRAFLDVKNGVCEISRAVVRSLVAVAEHHDEPLKDICLLTLAEILTKHPALLVSANGVGTLTDALANGNFPSPEGLIASFLHILDYPEQRRYLNTGREFEAMFAPFTFPNFITGNEEKLKTCAKAISAMLKSWPGFLMLSTRNAAPLRSLIESLQYPLPQLRDILLELLFDVLRIKQPSWSGTFLAGRRLTTYGRGNALAVEPSAKVTSTEDDPYSRFDLTFHFSATVLLVFIKSGLIRSLSNMITTEEDLALKRKATLLLTEVLKMAHHSLPENVSSNIQVLGELVLPISEFGSDSHSTKMATIYQIESINRTLNRTSTSNVSRPSTVEELAAGSQATDKLRYSPFMDTDQFRQAMGDTLVINHSNYVKWKWDLILGLIEGPLTNPKRLEDAIKNPKFLKRIMGFYRPFKYRFSMIRNTRPNQRYVRVGCALVRTLTQTPLGVQCLADSKLLRQIAECLAQVDRLSGLTSATPLFDPHQMTETLSGGYFAILGALSHNVEGIQLMERWHMMNMFYHIIDGRDRNDLTITLLGNMDFTLDTHLRVMLSQALTSADKEVRLHTTKILRKYAVGRVQYSAGLQDPSSSHWALRLVLTQLYDPDVEVCEVAVKILEEACNQRSHLEYVVKCRPALDHLGEIGAPLLLRFLSTSIGYKYLSGLDYISQEMDDWFLGRNDSYVGLVEASLARAYMIQSMPKAAFPDETSDLHDLGLAPAHFYRELARTEEGCRLLRQSGHFYEFASAVREFDLSEQDFEALNKVKGCLWAIGNIGSMDLGAPFLEEEDVVKAIVRIAEGAQVLSMKGTACYVLGLISRTIHGFEMLAENDWDTTVDSRGQSLGLCFPRHFERLCLNSVDRVKASTRASPEELHRYQQATTDDDATNVKILKLIVEMGNSVLYKNIAGDLRVMKARHATHFTQVKLFEKTLTILESHHYQLPARQYILDLFDKGLMRRVVLEEYMEDSEADST